VGREFEPLPGHKIKLERCSNKKPLEYSSGFLFILCYIFCLSLLIDYLDMIFPFSVNFNNRLKAIITADNQQKILQYIMKRILDNKANNVVIEGMRVTYKGSTSNWRGTLFRSVDDGIFNLIYKDNSWWLIYQINMRKLFIETAILSSIMGVFSLASGGPWWVGIAAFLWLCGVNWIINILRHAAVAADIAVGIDELIYGKKAELPEQDKMTGELKSWF
jgi:hypothetical protein